MMMLASELKSHLVDKLKDTAANVVLKWARLDRVQSLCCSGQVRSGWVNCGSGAVGSK